MYNIWQYEKPTEKLRIYWIYDFKYIITMSFLSYSAFNTNIIPIWWSQVPYPFSRASLSMLHYV